MHRWFFVIILIFALILSGCAGAAGLPGLISTATPLPPTPPPTASFTFTPLPTTAEPTSTATATPLPTSTATVTPQPSPTPEPAVLLGAGDIAICGEENLGDEQTAAIIARQIERYPQAVIFTAGDNAYGSGRAVEFSNCFGPSWGQFKDRIRPSTGNHEYMTDMAAPYFEYFGEAAGSDGSGYYSYDLNGWHIIAMNSNCNEVGCHSDSQQANWLRQDLERSSAECTLLYWHHPRWSSGLAGGYGSVNAFWRIANEYGAEIIVNGHDHNYERFEPMDAEGNADPYGVRQFVVGTGGGELRRMGEIQPNSAAHYAGGFGVIQFTLYPGRYEWQFIPTEGAFTDSGSGVCH